jgi:hypothetical protein
MSRESRQDVLNKLVEKVIMTRQDDLKKLVTDLEAASLGDNWVFRRLVCRTIELLGLSNADVAHQFGTSIPTIARWREGMSVPHPAMRSAVYGSLLEQVKECMREEEGL